MTNRSDRPYAIRIKRAFFFQLGAVYNYTNSEMITLSELLDILYKAADKVGCPHDKILVQINEKYREDGNSELIGFSLHWDRPETEGEAALRWDKERRSNKAFEDHERAEYERLSAKFTTMDPPA
jgi:hypothetical protein